MKPGDWVRFYTEEIHPFQTNLPNWKQGLLIEYHTWEKVARILYQGKLVSIHSSQVQLAQRQK